MKGRKNRRGNYIFAEENWKRREGITSRRIIYFSWRRKKAGKEKDGIFGERKIYFFFDALVSLDSKLYLSQ